jgi:hypothetical protein
MNSLILYMQELGGGDGQCSPPKAWRNIENNALSSLHKLLRNRLVSVYVGGTAIHPPPPTSRFRNNLWMWMRSSRVVDEI